MVLKTLAAQRCFRSPGRRQSRFAVDEDVKKDRHILNNKDAMDHSMEKVDKGWLMIIHCLPISMYL